MRRRQKRNLCSVNSDYFEDYIRNRGLQDRIRTYWGTNQADEDGLRRIVAAEFSTPLDLVIDDASRSTAPTQAFQTVGSIV